MTVQLFDRRASIVVQPASFTGVGSKKKLSQPWSSVPPYDGFDPMADLRVTFDVEKTIEPHPNRADIRVYNLTSSHRALIKKDDLVTLRAGYRGDEISELGPSELPIIFRGNVSRVFHRRLRTDWETKLSSGDGLSAIRNAFLNTLLPKGSTPKDVVKKITEKLQELGVEVMSDFDGSVLRWITEQFRAAASDPSAKGTGTGGDAAFKTARAILGRASDKLTQELDKVGLDWSVQNNVLVVRPKGGHDAQLPILLTPDTGLIDAVTETENGIAGTSLIIAGMEPGRLVQVESRTKSGEYVLTKTNARGDTEGNDWYFGWEAAVEGTKLEISASPV